MQFTSKTDLAKYENFDKVIEANSNFLMAFQLLSKEKSNAIKTIYSFCSYIDDIVDELENTDENIKIKKSRLAFWSNTLNKIYSDSNFEHPNLNKFIEVIKKYKIPQEHLNCLISTCENDLHQNRYSSIEELNKYIYGVAVVVGLISINIFEYKNPQTREYAYNLANALQLTNIIRDIKADKDRDFIYLPQDELHKFNYSENDIYQELYNDNFIELMKYQSKRAMNYFEKAKSSIPREDKYNLLPARIMGEIYYEILKEIEKNNFNVYNKKIRISNIKKTIIGFKLLINNLFNR